MGKLHASMSALACDEMDELCESCGRRSLEDEAMRSCSTSPDVVRSRALEDAGLGLEGKGRPVHGGRAAATGRAELGVSGE